MQFSTATLLAYSASLSQALVILTNTNYNTITEGQPFTITWSDADGPVTLLLKSGPSTDLATLQTIATGQTGTSYSWTPTGLASGTYAIEIQDTDDVNYSSQFTYQGSAAAAATTVPTPAASTPESSTPTDDPSTATPAASTPTDSASTPTSTPNTDDDDDDDDDDDSTSSSNNGTSSGSSTRTSSSSSSTSTNTPLSTNAGQKMGSPLALIFLTVAALMLSN